MEQVTDNHQSTQSRIDSLVEDAINSDNLNIVVDEETNATWNNVDMAVSGANNKVLLNTLAPEVSKNEEKKRKHKDILLKNVTIFLGLQFLAIFILVMTIIIAIIVFHALGNHLSSELVGILFGFFGTYTTSVIVELICILKYIVTNVFDTSISSLMEIFRGERDSSHNGNS